MQSSLEMPANETVTTTVSSEQPNIQIRFVTEITPAFDSESDSELSEKEILKMQQAINSSDPEPELRSNTKNIFEVVFFVKYYNVRPEPEKIGNYFSYYGTVDHVKCPADKRYAFVFMKCLDIDSKTHRTTTVLRKIISDARANGLKPEFYVAVAKSKNGNKPKPFQKHQPITNHRQQPIMNHRQQPIMNHRQQPITNHRQQPITNHRRISNPPNSEPPHNYHHVNHYSNHNVYPPLALRQEMVSDMGYYFENQMHPNPIAHNFYGIDMGRPVNYHRFDQHYH